MERIMRDFLWSGGIESKRDHLVSWEICCRSKEDERLGIGNMVSKNLSLLAKWQRRFSLEGHTLWHIVIVSKYDMQKNR